MADKQVEDAKADKAAEAKKKVGKADPEFMPNIKPQTGKSSSKATAKTKADQSPKPEAKTSPKKELGRVHIDPPTVPLIPGNSVTFWAEERPGRVVAKVSTGQGYYWVAASNGNGDARVSKILERSGDITVEFFEDGKAFASGTFTVR